MLAGAVWHWVVDMERRKHHGMVKRTCKLYGMCVCNKRALLAQKIASLTRVYHYYYYGSYSENLEALSVLLRLAQCRSHDWLKAFSQTPFTVVRNGGTYGARAPRALEYPVLYRDKRESGFATVTGRTEWAAAPIASGLV
jgi:hypothetical protein